MSHFESLGSFCNSLEKLRLAVKFVLPLGLPMDKLSQHGLHGPDVVLLVAQVLLQQLDLAMFDLLRLQELVALFDTGVSEFELAGVHGVDLRLYFTLLAFCVLDEKGEFRFGLSQSGVDLLLLLVEVIIVRAELA